MGLDLVSTAVLDVTLIQPITYKDCEAPHLSYPRKKKNDGSWEAAELRGAWKGKEAKEG